MKSSTRTREIVAGAKPIHPPVLLTQIEKVSVIIAVLGEAAARELLANARGQEWVQRVAAADLTHFTEEQIKAVLREFLDTLAPSSVVQKNRIAPNPKSPGAKAHPKTASGARASTLAEETHSAWTKIEQVSLGQMVERLESEHPQVSAIILDHLKTNKAATVLRHMNKASAQRVAVRLSNVGATPAEQTQRITHLVATQFL